MEPYLGEIRCFSFGKIPNGWLPCSGQILAINTNQALYALLGVSYGGDGTKNFALPNLNGVAPMHYNPINLDPNPYTDIGKSGGIESVTLTSTQVPPHSHLVSAQAQEADQKLPTNHYPTTFPAPHLGYASSDSAQVSMSPAVIGIAGGNQSHNNMQPYLVVNFCIATAGIWPQRPS